VRVIKYVVNVVPQVRGRVVEVPVEPNRLVKKGDVLFRIDPTPYELTVRSLEAQLANSVAGSKVVEASPRGAVGKVAEARSAIQQADASIAQIQVKLDLARLRVTQNQELVRTGAGDKFALERAQTDVRDLEAQLGIARSAVAQARAGETQARASERQIRQRIAGKVGNEYAPVAQVRAQLDNAKWELTQTTVVAPANGYAINVQLRPGSFTTAFPITPAMTIVEDTYQVIALYQQNELALVEPGDEAEFAINTYPGRIIKAKVDSIVWAQGQGQLQASGAIPLTGPSAQPPGRYAVKFDIIDRDRGQFFAAGAVGNAAIYTDHLHAIHIIRKVIIRVGSYLNYLVLKLH